MANRQYCSFDNKIKCDSVYELREFYRQMQVALESGRLVSFSYGTDTCPCWAKDCPRYLAAKQKQNSGR